MGFQIPRGFRCNHGLRHMVFFIGLMSFLLRPSIAIKMFASLPNALQNEDPNEIGDMIAAMRNDIVQVIDENIDYAPGIVATLPYTFSSGLRMLFRLVNWNGYTCNLGLGSEALHPVVQTPGVDLRTVAENTLFPMLEMIVTNDYGEGGVIESGVSVDFYPDLDNDAENPSDDDPDDHESEDDGGEEGAANIDVATGLVAMDGIFRRNHSKYLAANSSTARVGRPYYGLGVSNISDRHTLLQKHNVSGNSVDVPTDANSTNVTFYHRKFPTDGNGDCDLPSLILMTARSSFYDDHNTHTLPVLNPADKIWSPNARFYLVMQIDCNLVLYDAMTNTALWSSFTNDEGVACYASITMNGALAVYDGNHNLLFRTQTACLGNKFPGLKCWTNTILQVQDDGNLVLYIFNTTYPLFASNTVQCEGGCSV